LVLRLDIEAAARLGQGLCKQALAFCILLDGGAADQLTWTVVVTSVQHGWKSESLSQPRRKIEARWFMNYT